MGYERQLKLQGEINEEDGIVVETHKITCIKNGQEKDACIELSKNQYHVGITFSMENLQLKKQEEIILIHWLS